MDVENQRKQAEYREYLRGQEAGGERIKEEQAVYLSGFDHEKNWMLIEDLVETGMRHRGEPRTTSGFVDFYRRLGVVRDE